MNLDELDFEHPRESVARRPAARRDAARLLVVGDEERELSHRLVRDLPELFEPGEVLVVNDSRVLPARLDGRKESGGRVEVVIVGRRADGAWLALVRASRAPRPGTRLLFGEDASALVRERQRELFVLDPAVDLARLLERRGRIPLPPYIGREADDRDERRYQTLHARREGEWGRASASAAAPTAGLHLTPELRARLEERGVRLASVTLGVGFGTFQPIQARSVEEHRMHVELIEVPRDTALAVSEARSRGRRVCAVGTTALRALEAAATAEGRVRPVRGATGLFLSPGSPFRVVERLLTNFHQPRSSLLALVLAFGGVERVRDAYRRAVAEGYRLFSYGDAMLLERAT